MKRWRDARSSPEKLALLVRALKTTGGNRRKAAALLGVSREWVSRLLAGHGLHLHNAVTSVISGHEDNSDHEDTGVTLSDEKSLTYAEAARSFLAMQPAPDTEVARDQRQAISGLKFEPAHRAYLLRLASERQIKEGGHNSVSAVLAEIIQRVIDTDPAEGGARDRLGLEAKRRRGSAR